MTQAVEEKTEILYQACPFCGAMQELRVFGHITKPENNKEALIQQDAGYSFCACKNIFFTDWKNIEQSVYNPDYVKKYASEYVGDLLKNYLRKYSSWLLSRKGLPLMELGTVNEALLEEAERMGFKPVGCDFFARDAKYPMIFGDFESVDIEAYRGTVGVLIASHIFEHFKEPLKALEKCHSLMKHGGRILIAMPDPFFIDWGRPYHWGHWHLREHHIMWDMDSFAKEMEVAGFKVLLKRHNTDQNFVCLSDFHIIAEKL